MNLSNQLPGAGQSGAFSVLDLGGIPLDLRTPRVMGILNVTPDSFSDGGRYVLHSKALDHAAKLIGAGAALLDVGGESTRPGAGSVSVDEELDRVIPIIAGIRERFDIPISIDTSKPEVMRTAVDAGASMINDVYALRADGALEMAAECGVPVCLMHMRGAPRTMQRAPHYTDVTGEVYGFLEQRLVACVAAGIPQNRLLVDPGFGFGKSLQHNLELLHALPKFLRLGRPVLVGLSRKSMIGKILDRPTDDRLVGSIALATLAAWLGAAIVRVHDVEETVDAVRIATAVRTID